MINNKRGSAWTVVSQKANRVEQAISRAHKPLCVWSFKGYIGRLCGRDLKEHRQPGGKPELGVLGIVED